MRTETTQQQEISQNQAKENARVMYEGEAALSLRETVKKLGLHWVLKELALIHVESELTPSRRAVQYPQVITHRPVPHSRHTETLVNGFSIG